MDGIYRCAQGSSKHSWPSALLALSPPTATAQRGSHGNSTGTAGHTGCLRPPRPSNQGAIHFVCSCCQCYCCSHAFAVDHTHTGAMRLDCIQCTCCIALSSAHFLEQLIVCALLCPVRAQTCVQTHCPARGACVPEAGVCANPPPLSRPVHCHQPPQRISPDLLLLLPPSFPLHPRPPLHIARRISFSSRPCCA
jgi:hypothetical protein